MRYCRESHALDTKQTENAMHDMKHGDKEIRSLKCALTTEEITARGEEIAVHLGDRGEVEAERKASISAFRARLEEIDQRCSDLAAEIRDKAELRDVEVSAERGEGDLVLIRQDQWSWDGLDARHVPVFVGWLAKSISLLAIVG